VVFIGVLQSKTFQKSSITGQSFISLFEGICRIGRENDIWLFVVLARQIWLRRNKYIHEGLFAHPDTLVRQAYNSLEEYDAACSREGMMQELNGTGNGKLLRMGSTKQNRMLH
jgi:hypothetical protein